MSAGGGLSERDRRALRLGLLIVAPALAAVLLVGPYVAGLEQARDRLASERALMGRELALLDVADDYKAGALGAQQAVATRSRSLFDGDPTLAAGALARYTAERAAGSSVLLESAVARPGPGDDAGVTAVRIEIRALGDVEGVLRFLRELEDGPRLVHVERLSLERRDRFSADAGDDVQLISLGATLAGYIMAPSGTEGTQ